jgi:hypothetical protein
MAARPESIGMATMLDDGTIVLDLRAETDDTSAPRTTGHARYVLAPSDPRYAETIRHLGPMKPGETRSVPPWPSASKR